MNRLAGHTNTYHTYGFEEALEGIASAGYQHVELSAVPGWTEHVDLNAPPPRCVPSCSATGWRR